MNRRTLLKTSIAASAASVAVSAGLLSPGRVLAAYPKAAFAAKDGADALSAALGMGDYEESPDISIKAPDIAENGSVVPVTISSHIGAVESISILSEANAAPLIASFRLMSAEPYISTRIKMGKTGNIVAIVKAGGKLYAARKEVKITIGGCGG